MSPVLAAYASYAVGSVVFLAVALSRGTPILALGSTMFLLGTLLLVGRELRPSKSGSGK